MKKHAMSMKQMYRVSFERNSERVKELQSVQVRPDSNVCLFSTLLDHVTIYIGIYSRSAVDCVWPVILHY